MSIASDTTVPLRQDLKLAGLLAIAAALATAGLFPYLLVVMPQLLAKVPASIPLWLLIIVQMLQAGLLLGLMAFAGLRMGHRVGLGAPWLGAWLSGQSRPRLAWPLAICMGLLAGLAIVALDPIFSAYMPHALTEIPAPDAKASAGVGFLASFYGGIAEEIQLRLFVMTLMVWLLSLLKDKQRSDWMVWLALVVAAVLFGAGHLPAAAKIWPMDGIVIARTLLLNGIGGVVFGWLYWKRGLETAMLAHFSTDLVLHVIAPLAFG